MMFESLPVIKFKYFCKRRTFSEIIMKNLYHEYLGPVILSGFDNYKYCSVDTSPLSNYVMHPFWNKMVKLCPLWVAPNLLTLVGFLCCVGHFLVLTVLDYDFTSGTAAVPDINISAAIPLPRWVWLLVAVLLFLSHTLDGIDGKQARRTGTSGPIGELFDHGLDAWAAIFVTCSGFHIFGRNIDFLSVSLFRMFCLQCLVHFSIMISHWEKYNTGVLYLPWGYDFSMVGAVCLYLINFAGGQHIWKFRIPGVDTATIIEAAIYTGIIGMAVPIAVNNIRKSYTEGTGKMRSFSEANRPLASFFVALVLTFAWVVNSKNNILETDPSCFFFMTGEI